MTMPEPTEPPTCIVCGSTAHPAYEKDGADYWACNGCGLLFLHPLPDPGEMHGFADSEYSGGAYEEYARARDLKMATFRDRCRIIRGFAPSGRLLDVGAACGFMIDVGLEEGYDAHGIEFSSAAIVQASDAARPRIIEASIDSLDTAALGRFDLITAFDIVEHSLAPLEFLQSLTKLVRPGGVIVLSTPDVDHVLRHIMRSRWPHLQPLQHTYLFSRQEHASGAREERARSRVAHPGHQGAEPRLPGRPGRAAQSPRPPHLQRDRRASYLKGSDDTRSAVGIGEMLVVARWNGEVATASATGVDTVQR